MPSTVASGATNRSTDSSRGNVPLSVTHFEKAEYFEHPQRVAHRTATDAEAPGEEPFRGRARPG